MATIITKTATNVNDIKEAFAKYNRDYYPDDVYQFILGTLESSEEEYVKLDVIAWSCDIAQTDLEDTEFDDIDELVYDLDNDYTVICDNGETVWYLY